MTRLALVGDYSVDVPAHRAIPAALTLVRTESPTDFAWEWISTRDLHRASTDLLPYAAIWAVPGSPYANPAGVFAAIRFARQTRRPFLGTCGGFQHALIEFARDVLGLADADHAETNPAGSALVVEPLTCSLVEHTGAITFSPGSRLHEIYGTDTAHEGYRCRYGPAAAYRDAFERAGLRFTAHDESGAIRGAELPLALHPFFIGTLFQPERAALRGVTPPLVRAFVHAAHAFAAATPR